MKNFLILFSVFAIALFVRLYNFESRFTFGPEQARSLIVSSNYILDRPTLLGQEYFRSNSYGHKLYTSAIFNYSLVPLLLITNYDPYLITIYFAILNIVTGIVLYHVTKKIFGSNIAIISTILFLFNSYMIYHSLFIWVLNYLPLLGILNFYFLWKIYINKYNALDIFWLGLISGVGFGLEYLYAIAIIISLFILFKYTKTKLKSILLFLIGSVLGDLPQVLFDIRHDLYHLKSLFRYAIDTFNRSSDAGFIYYHFLEFWPILLILLAVFFYALSKQNRAITIFLLSVYLFINLKSPLINFNKPVGMVDGLKYMDLKKASKVIAENANNNFNVVTLYDFDTRGYTLRYLTQYIFIKKPQNEISYQNVYEIYALAANNYNFKVNNPWELNVFKAQNVVKLEDVGSGYGLYKLTK